MSKKAARKHRGQAGAKMNTGLIESSTGHLNDVCPLHSASTLSPISLNYTQILHLTTRIECMKIQASNFSQYPIAYRQTIIKPQAVTGYTSIYITVLKKITNNAPKVIIITSLFLKIRIESIQGEIRTPHSLNHCSRIQATRSQMTLLNIVALIFNDYLISQFQGLHII